MFDGTLDGIFDGIIDGTFDGTLDEILDGKLLGALNGILDGKLLGPLDGSRRRPAPPTAMPWMREQTSKTKIVCWRSHFPTRPGFWILLRECLQAQGWNVPVV